MSVIPMRLSWTTTNSEQVDDRIVEHRERIGEGEARQKMRDLNEVINSYEPDELISVEVVIKHRRGYEAVTGFTPPKS